MKEIWSAESKIRAERNLWITVMKTQAKLGFDIPTQAISDYENVRDQIDLASIDKREKELRHDVKARIEEFNALAGHQFIHIAMTSRDLTENIEALQIVSALKLIQSKSIALLARLAEKSAEYKALPIPQCPSSDHDTRKAFRNDCRRTPLRIFAPREPHRELSHPRAQRPSRHRPR
jgi:adenylosuccinate lyase